MISDKLLYEPANNPKIPKIMRKMFFQKIYRKGPKSLGHKTQISMIAGNAMPKADRHNAPKREMNKPNSGIATAKRTEKKNIKLVSVFRNK